MAEFIAFLVAFIITTIEISSKYERAPRIAILNIWALFLMIINGIVSAIVFYFSKNLGVLSFNISNPYIQAIIIGIEWQVLLRSKVFSIGSSNENQSSIEVGLEYIHKRYSKIFEKQIDDYQEQCVLNEIWKLHQQLSDNEIRERAISFIKYRRTMNQIVSDSIADDYIKQIENGRIDAIMYTIFEMSSLNTLKSIFSTEKQALRLPTTPRVRITLVNAGGSLNEEFVQIQSFTNGPIDLYGWTISDQKDHVYTFPKFILKPDATVKLYTGRGTNTLTNLYWRRKSFVWNNPADKAILRNKDGDLIHTYKYSNS